MANASGNVVNFRVDFQVNHISSPFRAAGEDDQGREGVGEGCIVHDCMPALLPYDVHHVISFQSGFVQELSSALCW